MPRRTWTARIDGVDHRIELDHGIWSGRRRVVVDGWQVHETNQLFDLGGDVTFAISGHQGMLRIVPRSLGYLYAIALDGLWVNGGGLVTHLPSFVRLASYAIIAHGLFLLALAAIWPGEIVSLFLLVGLRAIAASYIALQLMGGTRESWFTALGYAGLTGIIGLALGLAGALNIVDLDHASLSADLRAPLGLAGDVAFAAAIAGLLLAPDVRRFVVPHAEAGRAV